MGEPREVSRWVEPRKGARPPPNPRPPPPPPALGTAAPGSLGLLTYSSARDVQWWSIAGPLLLVQPLFRHMQAEKRSTYILYSRVQQKNVAGARAGPVGVSPRPYQAAMARRRALQALRALLCRV
jgi:hypothetical protein